MNKILKLSTLLLVMASFQQAIAGNQVKSCIDKVNNSLGIQGETPITLQGVMKTQNQSFSCVLTMATTEEKNSVYVRLEARDLSNANEIVSANTALLFDSNSHDSQVDIQFNRCDTNQNVSVYYAKKPRDRRLNNEYERFIIQRDSTGKITKVYVHATGNMGSKNPTVCTF